MRDVVPAVVMPPASTPRVDEAAVVPLAAVALQKVLARARLVLGVVVLGDSPSSSLPVMLSEPSPLASEPPSAAAAAATVESAAIVVAAPVVAAPVVSSSAAPVEAVVVHVSRRGPAHVVRGRAEGWTVRWTMRGWACVVSTWTWA